MFYNFPFQFNKWVTVFFVMALCACQAQELRLEAVTFSEVEELPSGSGLTMAGTQLYAVGDDAPFLFQLNRDYQIEEKLLLMDTLGFRGGKIPKKLKPDYEALEFLDPWGLLVLGSGSRSPQRDQMLLVPLNNPSQKEVLDGLRFFAYLRNHPALATGALNIEAVAYGDSTLWVGNRGTNVLFGFAMPKLFDALRGGLPIPEARIIELSLPSIDGITAGFSGAVVVPHQNKIIFTASVEGTDDTYNDGAILGSFIGLLDLETMQIKTLRIPETKGPMKVEAVALRSVGGKGQAQIVMITDDDHSLNSWIIEATLHW